MDKFGIIQSRGLGDIFISLPIAQYYHTVEQKEIYWPICEEFILAVEKYVPWVNWLSVKTDKTGLFFSEEPLRLLKKAGVEDYICLYQALTSMPELKKESSFQFMKFDQSKYLRAGVPFLNKWKLNECFERDLIKEAEVIRKLTNGKPYVVAHLEGSDYSANIDLSHVTQHGYEIVKLTKDSVASPLDAIGLLEGAEALFLLDSVYANIVDQLQLDVDKYFIPRSHIQLTPVLGSDWTILEPEQIIKQRTTIFG
jgi:hypothetical protein